MSRIGKNPVVVPEGVEARVEGQRVTAKGPKGELSLRVVDEVSVAFTDEGIRLEPRSESKRARSMWGLSRSLVQNIVTGVKDGFEKKLEISGVGYRAQAQGSNLNLSLGYANEVVYPVPEGIQVQTPRPVEVIVSGIEKQKVGQVAAEIRRLRPPEPYKGKGIRYSDEQIFRKEGKKK